MEKFNRVARIVFWGLLVVIALRTADWIASDAWKEVALHTGLKIFCIATAALIVAVVVMGFVIAGKRDSIFELEDEVEELQRSGNPQYVSYLESQAESFRSQYFEIQEKNRSLSEELGKALGRIAEMEPALQYYGEKYKNTGTVAVDVAKRRFLSPVHGKPGEPAGAPHETEAEAGPLPEETVPPEETAPPEEETVAAVDVSSGKFISPDGMSKSEKEARAFYLSKDLGLSKEQVAAELGLSMKSVGTYISRGRQDAWFKHDEYEDEYAEKFGFTPKHRFDRQDDRQGWTTGEPDSAAAGEPFDAPAHSSPIAAIRAHVGMTGQKPVKNQSKTGQRPVKQTGQTQAIFEE